MQDAGQDKEKRKKEWSLETCKPCKHLKPSLSGSGMILWLQPANSFKPNER